MESSVRASRGLQASSRCGECPVSAPLFRGQISTMSCPVHENAHTRTHTHTHAHACKHTHTHIRAHTRTHAPTHIQTRTYTATRTRPALQSHMCRWGACFTASLGGRSKSTLPLYRHCLLRRTYSEHSLREEWQSVQLRRVYAVVRFR